MQLCCRLCFSGTSILGIMLSILAMNYKECPNCNKKLDGFLASRYILEQNLTDFINSLEEHNSTAYCNECGNQIIESYRYEISEKKRRLTQELNQHTHQIPIVTTHFPKGWDYKIMEVVSSQSVSCTGFLSELSGSWADFTGGQSNTLANKISSGEEICKKKIQFQCALIGGNAIIATDIDYSEVGGGREMLMVCMAGTAVIVDIQSEEFAERAESMKIIHKNIKELARLNKIPNT